MALPASWSYDFVTYKPTPICGNYSSFKNDTVKTEQAAASAFPADAAETRTVYTREKSSSISVTAQNHTSDEKHIPTDSRKTVHFAVLESTVISKTDFHFSPPRNRRRLPANADQQRRP